MHRISKWVMYGRNNVFMSVFFGLVVALKLGLGTVST